MASSSTVTAGVDVVEAAQYNDLRTDVLDPTIGHDHEGVNGKPLGTSALNDSAVTTAKINDEAVTGVKLAGSAVTNAKIATDAVNTAEILDSAVSLAKLAADSVDDTKAGNRIIQMVRRQGDAGGNWDGEGSTNHTPTTVRMQVGVRDWSGGAVATANVDITFPIAFGARPIVIACAERMAGSAAIAVMVRSGHTSTTACSLAWEDSGGNTHTAMKIYWFAIGPE